MINTTLADNCLGAVPSLPHNEVFADVAEDLKRILII
jgi:hypothetical protein